MHADSKGVAGVSSAFGASLKRKEDPALLTGKGRFVDDLKVPGVLHAAVVRSQHAHARILSINTSSAAAARGVHCVLTFADLPASLQEKTLPLLVPHPAIKQAFLQYVLAKDEVCYVGEPVAIVVADSRHLAEDAAALVEVDYESLPVAADCRDAIQPGAPVAHLGAPSNIGAATVVAYGNTDKAFASAPHIIKESFFQHRGGALAMECRAALMQYDPVEDAYTMYGGLQAPHRIKRIFMDLLDLGDNQIRVIAPDVGGGFGPKGPFYPEYALLAVCARKLQRPVKWIEDRFENFIATHQERDQYWDMELAVDNDGKILGLRGRLIHDGGAYLPWGVVLPWIAVTTVPGPYKMPAFSVELISAITNKVATSPVRGSGRPQGIFVMERLMDRAAQRLGLDRTEIRRRNFIRADEMPYDVGLIYRDGKPVTYDSGDYPTAQQVVLDHIDYEGFRQRQAQARTEGRYIGIGVANYVEGTGLGPFEGATVRITTAGKIFIYTGAAPQGQSHKTTLSQIAADALGVDYSQITVVTADTAGIALGIGTFAARTAVNAGNSVHLAAHAVREKIFAIAAATLGVPKENLILEGGSVFINGKRESAKSLREIAVLAAGTPGVSMVAGVTAGLEHTSYFSPARATYSNGTQAMEVEVDIETGKVTILRCVLSHDCGRVINPLVVEGQVIGGVAHGIGNALFEHMRFDENAQPLSAHFGEYLLPHATDIPKVEMLHLETPSPLNPLGIKGAGEAGTLPVAAAIASAVEDALSEFNVPINDVPIAPQRIVELLGEVALGTTK